MNIYEKLLAEYTEELIVDDKAILPDGLNGYYINNNTEKIILLSDRLKTDSEKNCILAEELGHYHTTTGNILDQSKVENRKQEIKARRWAVKKLIRVEQFIDAYKAGIRNRHELAEFLEVTEEFIDMAIEHFKGVYGCSHKIGEYTIYFSPLWVYKNLD